MRLYSFTHCYISDIQRGIQTAHIVGDMLGSKTSRSQQTQFEWARDHKTIIVLNGGNSESLKNIQIDLATLTNNELLQPFHNSLTWFEEDQQSMEGMRTAVGIVIPEFVYELTPYYRNGIGLIPPELSSKETYAPSEKLAVYLSQFRLA